MAENLQKFDKLSELRDNNSEKLNEYLTEKPVEKSEKDGDTVGVGVVGSDTDDSSKDDKADEQKAEEELIIQEDWSETGFLFAHYIIKESSGLYRILN